MRAINEGAQRAVVAQLSLGIEAGDQLVFREWKSTLTASVETGAYTGAWLVRRVTHVAPGGPATGVDSDHQVVSLNSSHENAYAITALKRELNLAERQSVSADRFWRIKERKERQNRGTLDDVLPPMESADLGDEGGA